MESDARSGVRAGEGGRLAGELAGHRVTGDPLGKGADMEMMKKWALRRAKFLDVSPSLLLFFSLKINFK